ncbi:MAG: TasA family protein [Solirubrobacterales bacterium]
MNLRNKILLTVLCVGALGSLAALGVFGAFSSTTTNPGNNITAGTVVISDNDAGGALYNLTNAKPGDSVSKCIKVTYTGTLDSDVHIYTPSSIGSLGQYVDLTITPGSQASPSFPSCTGFTPDAGGALFTGTLQNFGSTSNSYASGIVDFPGSGTKWATNDSVVYQVTATLQSGAPDAAQGLTTNAHTFTWEARNQ